MYLGVIIVVLPTKWMREIRQFRLTGPRAPPQGRRSMKRRPDRAMSAGLSTKIGPLTVDRKRYKQVALAQGSKMPVMRPPSL